MQKMQLKVQKREVLGKKVKNLRKQGLIPTTIYGKKIKSESLQVNTKDFLKVYKKAKETGLVDLLIDEKEPRPVLIHNIQKDPISGIILHADFYQVDLKEKVKAMVPIVAQGEAKAVTDNKGVILHVLSEIEVEALPTELPEKIEVDVTILSDVDQSIFVKDLPVDKSKIAVLTSPEEIVFKVGSLITKEVEEQMKAEEEAKAQAQASSAEGEVKAEGSATAAEEKKEVSEEKTAEK